ncbi:hypothetical protein PC2016_1236 [Pseudoalteromonas carrageenovora]|uniref:Uncharacterized protein n=1 Tax=Pseudoalteromonas carrageenovora IAM 12662 TaxID=1314868 RepID=A0A2K4X897_PSEVC|nr:hypothetical protein [Pseudoalteromonas carrageenovora]MBE0382878.1 hypothetical protein [Pseudoalteromonas carrageenovora IAM 12662]MDO6545681.1 hypothetical protein [Pseudoalteromonas carrageenovora]MDO6830392.1 hypothetical protein [Pseudoalteromonas carrageenovora]QBJ71461.1 hypothetical protein PC2016_1236 [Pseudoalteromonas carrageenovora]SOU40547.1 conserved membrane protein of unknown function [Pseudoalteromonas carrageenovora IAM 12662]
MQNTLVDFCVAISWALLVLSACLVLFSKYKHTDFKQRLFKFLNSVLVIHIATITFYLTHFKADSLKTNLWLLIALQIALNITCFMSVKRRKAKTRPSLDSFSMD